MTPSGPVLLYDGSCGFCAQSVQLVLRHDRDMTLRFAPLQGAFGGAVCVRHPELAAVDSVVWVDPATADHPERILVRSDAALRVARYLGGWWHLLLIGHVIPRVIRDALYDMVARHRHRLMRGAPQCVVPTPETRARFLLEDGDA